MIELDTDCALEPASEEPHDPRLGRRIEDWIVSAIDDRAATGRNDRSGIVAAVRQQEGGSAMISGGWARFRLSQASGGGPGYPHRPGLDPRGGPGRTGRRPGGAGRGGDEAAGHRLRGGRADLDLGGRRPRLGRRSLPGSGAGVDQTGRGPRRTRPGPGAGWARSGRPGLPRRGLGDRRPLARSRRPAPAPGLDPRRPPGTGQPSEPAFDRW